MNPEYAPPSKLEHSVFPILTDRYKDFVAPFDSRLHPLLDQALFSHHHMPLSEATHASLMAIATKLACDLPTLFQKASETGYFFAYDSHKVKAINDHFGPEVADRYVAGNMHLLLATWQELGYLDMTLKCSGDEGYGLLLPMPGAVIDENTVQSTLQQKISQQIEQDSEFNQLNNYLKSTFPSEPRNQVGLTLHLKKASECMMRRPAHIRDSSTPTSTTFNIRARQLGSAIIDACDNKPIATDEEFVPILTVLQVVGSLPIQFDTTSHPTFHPDRLPVNIKNIYLAIRATLEDDPHLIAQAQALALHAAYESLYSRRAEVRRSEQLPTDIQDLVNQGYIVHIGRISDREIKDTNAISHVLGDHELIATVNILQHLTKDIPHFRLYQQGGNYYYLTFDEKDTIPDDSNWHKVIQLIGDSLSLNGSLLQKEMRRTKQPPSPDQHKDTSSRVLPFIVTCSRIYNPITKTSQVVQIDSTNLDNLTQIISDLTETHRILEHLVPFVVTSLLIPTFLSNLTSITEFFEALEIPLKSRDLDTIPLNHTPSLSKYLRVVTAFTRYLSSRPQSKDFFLSLAEAYLNVKDPHTLLEQYLSHVKQFLSQFTPTD